jgi:hypothetical protein
VQRRGARASPEHVLGPGCYGTIDPTLNIATGVNIVDNTFAVPAASGCGFTFLDKPLITAAVNLKEGLPAAAGQNSAILSGTTKLGSSAATAASVD